MFLESQDRDNVLTYNVLFNKKMKYITFPNLKDIFFDDKRYVDIIKIGDEYNLYICLRKDINNKYLRYIQIFIAIMISDFFVVNKVSNIKEGLYELDIALEIGKEIHAIPGDIFKYENYLANFAIKQGAIPICSKYDINYILKEI